MTVNVHRHVLVTHSRFFAAKLSERWPKQQQQQRLLNSNLIEITDVEDVEIYLVTLRLMYCQDVKRSLMKENVPRVLDILKVVGFFLYLPRGLGFVVMDCVNISVLSLGF